jgi:hypothetical protein
MEAAPVCLQIYVYRSMFTDLCLVDQRTRNSARQPRSTQRPRRSVPQV